MENPPVLVMLGDKILHDNLKKTLMTEEDLMAKLREANAFDLTTVKGVVFESTGDVSVLHGKGEISDKVMSAVSDYKTKH